MSRYSSNDALPVDFLYSVVSSWDRRPSRIAVAVAMGVLVLRRAARGAACVGFRPPRRFDGVWPADRREVTGAMRRDEERPSEPRQPTRSPRRVQVTYSLAGMCRRVTSYRIVRTSPPLSKRRWRDRRDLRGCWGQAISAYRSKFVISSRGLHTRQPPANNSHALRLALPWGHTCRYGGGPIQGMEHPTCEIYWRSSDWRLSRFAAIGWYCEWYKLTVTRTKDGQPEIKTTVNTEKVADDSVVVLQASGATRHREGSLRRTETRAGWHAEQYLGPDRAGEGPVSHRAGRSCP